MANRLPITPPDISGLTYLSPLGSGGFADVFLYKQSMPARQVAVKVFVNKFRANSAEAVSFMAEANNLAKLGGHPNIVNIFEANISRTGNPFISMEYCPSSLGTNWRTQPLGLSKVLDIGVQIASALETVHRNGLVHRDVKPSNILVTSFGTPVLSDFGISGQASAEERSEQVAMSLPWSAPEVVNLQSTGTTASDIWALGATLYSLLAGRSPFEVDNPKLNENDKLKARIIKALYTPIPSGGIPQIVEEVLNKAMQRDPNLRYSSMQEFAMALNEVQSKLDFMVTRLTIANAEPLVTGEDTYPCGHPRVKLEGGAAVYVQARNSRKSSTQTLSDDECPKCASVVPEQAPKRKLRISPIAIIVFAAIALGFAGTLFVLQLAGGH